VETFAAQMIGSAADLERNKSMAAMATTLSRS
jgi:hypothetical protein